ncbi:response regulator [Desulforhopalus singaporensis]|uniref:histidine kinase n=1 Tax=Desulforhopalus singaporensis TaxID=91360 RepID=A0A1H0TPY1_9BACT|nr:response regulator [Desulforhopalus singaporensis]SDP55688.1 PAS domain S-box-containing protein [Desulforhopalus singaporensis]
MTTPPSSAQSHAANILVIDDEPRIRDACRIVLSENGFEVAVAPDGEQGLQMIQQKHYDIILVDLMMPSISGFDVLSEVRKNHPDTVVIVITGYATLEHSIEAMKRGAFDFIPKPFTPDQLRAVVNKSLKYTSALQDIADSRSRLKMLLNRLTDGVMTTDTNKLIVQANPSFLHMIGYHGEEVLGKHVADIISDGNILEAIDQALSMGPETFSEITNELRITCHDQEKIYSCRCAPFRGRTKNNLGTITVLHDITSLEMMNQMKSDFVSMVSHEVRSPMNSLLMQLKNIKDGLAGEVTDKQKEILERASEKILNLNNLVTELLDLSRIESGLISHEKEQVDMVGLLTEQLNFHAPYGAEKNITIDLKLADDIPPIFANRQNMDEVFSNLITNAIKYSPENASITISGETEFDYLKVAVSDTGFGMAEEDLAKIFTRFYRVKDQNTRNIQGTGLGLSLVKSIIESHHGSIRVNSVPGSGTTFTVYLPLQES